MLNGKVSIKSFISAVGACVFLLLVYVSVLGVNDSVKGVAKTFLSNIADKEYSRAVKLYSDESKNKFKTLDDSMTFHFRLELALLEYFGLMDDDGYKIDIKRENMWIPFFKSDELNVSVTLSSKEDSSFMPGFLQKEQKKPLKNFITFIREDERWKIKQVNIQGSEIEKAFDEMKSKVEMNKYVKITPDGFVLNRAEIELAKISPIEQRVIVHNLQTALETITSK